MDVSTLLGRIVLSVLVGLAVGAALWLIVRLLDRAFGLTTRGSPEKRRFVAFGASSLIGAAAALTAAVNFLNLTGGGTPAPPPTITDPTAIDQRQAILEYARGLEFDSVTHGASDLQHLTSPVVSAEGDTVALPLGPLAAIYPEKNAHRNKIPDLLRGRIVARIWVDEPGYDKLGLRPGVNWVWVDDQRAPPVQPSAAVATLRDLEAIRSAARTAFVREGATPAESAAVSGLFGDAVARALAPQPGRPENVIRRESRRSPPSDTIRAVIIPDDPTAPAAIRPLYLFRRTHAPFNTPLAKWLFREDDDGGWINCAKDGCCCTSFCVD